MMSTKQRAFAALCNGPLEAEIDLGFVRDRVQTTYKVGGRPSVGPVVFFKLQLVMFFEGVRSERQLMRMAADRLSAKWLRPDYRRFRTPWTLSPL